MQKHFSTSRLAERAHNLQRFLKKFSENAHEIGMSLGLGNDGISGFGACPKPMNPSRKNEKK